MITMSTSYSPMEIRSAMEDKAKIGELLGWNPSDDDNMRFYVTSDSKYSYFIKREIVLGVVTYKFPTLNEIEIGLAGP